MKLMGSIIMYSGMPVPSTELDEETGKEIATKLFHLEERAENIPNFKLGFRGYSLLWIPTEEGMPYVQVQVHEGVVEISCFGVRSAYKDTVGFEEYVKEKLAPCLKQHQEEAAKAMNTLYEELSRISQQEKI